MTISEAECVVQEVYSRIDPNARLIWGAQVDPDLEQTVRTMIVVTGVKIRPDLRPWKRQGYYL